MNDLESSLWNKIISNLGGRYARALYYGRLSVNNSRPTYFCTQCPENPNMMHTQGGAIRSDQGSELGQKTVGVQD